MSSHDIRRSSARYSDFGCTYRLGFGPEMVVQSLGGSALAATRPRTMGTDAQSVGCVCKLCLRKNCEVLLPTRAFKNC